MYKNNENIFIVYNNSHFYISLFDGKETFKAFDHAFPDNWNKDLKYQTIKTVIFGKNNKRIKIKY